MRGFVILAASLALLACRGPRPVDPDRPLVLVYQPLGTDPRPLDRLLDSFRAEHPGVRVKAQLIPNASDLAHQYFLTALGGGSTDFDVLVVDVIWVPEFARAGWIADLGDELSPEELRRDFLPGPAEAVIVDGRVFAVPWYVDVGLLYYRTDLVPRAPRTYRELEASAREAMARDPSVQGYVWQGRQYEGLVCNVFEALWGHGGQAMRGGRLVLDTREAADALAYLRRLVASGISPPSTTSAAEEETRRAFQSGRAAMMRNWPYAWSEAQAGDSPIRGKVAIAPLPTVSGEPGPGALGGWQLAVNAHLPPERRRLAARLVRHLTSLQANLELALAYGRNPPRRAAYEDPAIARQAPFITALGPIFERARPRPVTPYYELLSDALQGEFSAAVAGVRSPEEALARLQARIDHVLSEDAR